MKKKIMAMLLAGVMVLAAGCAGKGKVTVGEYKGLALTSITQEDLDAEITGMLEYYAELEEVFRAAKEGDTVNINFVGKIDGVAFDGGTDNSEAGTDLKLGSNRFIDGFEDGLIGAVAGEIRDLNLKFPEDYGKEELNGKDVVFTVTVNAVKEEVVPELTDEFIQSMSTEYKTVEEYTTALREALNYETYYEQVTEQLMASSTVEKYNEKEVAAEKLERIEYYTNYATYYGSYYGFDTETAIQYVLGFESTEAFEKEMGEYAYEVIKNKMIIEEIAELEDIKITDEIYDTKVAELAESYEYESVESFLEAYEEEDIRLSILAELVMQFVIDNAVITDPQ